MHKLPEIHFSEITRLMKILPIYLEEIFFSQSLIWNIEKHHF
jgi:DNA-binding GntR family transcriptional regulator